MPSKPKKQPKTPSSSSKSQSLSSSPSPATIQQPQEDDFQKALLQASTKFPSFISPSSLISLLSEFDSSPSKKGSKIWLSEASFLSSSISPGSLVSVSLASSGGNLRSGFPLSSLAAECSEYFGVDCEEDVDDDKAGNFFVLATAFPSSKLLKNGVRISSSLSYSLGCPTAGRVVFVHPVRGGSLNSIVESYVKPCTSQVDHPLLYRCNELSIRLIPFKTRALSSEPASPSKNCSGKTMFQRENGEVSSPRTPSINHSRPCSPSSSKSSFSLSNNSVSRVRDTKSSYFDSVEIKEVLGDENAKKLLQHTAVSWLHSRTLLLGNFVTVPVLSRVCLFEVLGMKGLPADGADKGSIHISHLVHNADDAFIIDRGTKINICSESDIPEERLSTPGGRKSRDINVKIRDEVTNLGGLGKEYTFLRDIISSSMKNVLSSLGLRTTKGVLLYGPPGTGKTSLAQLCAHDAGVSFFKVNGPEIVSQYFGESEQALHDVFKSASDAAPSVVFIDELDAIAPARKEGGDELSQRMVATLLNLMDGISRTEGLLIVAATNRVECIEPALRRPGRLDREIEIGVPSSDQRLDILTTILDRMEHNLSLAQIQQLAVATHGFVGADLAALSNEAAMVCLRRSIKSNKCKKALNLDKTVCNGFGMIMDSTCHLNNGGNLFLDDSPSSGTIESADSTDSFLFPNSGVANLTCDSQEVVADNYFDTSTTQDHLLKISFEDFERARMKIRPSAMREVILEVPKVRWEDVGGQKEVKAQLMEAVEWPQKHQDAFKRIGTQPPTGVLMFGPPGCSKTLMARAVASEAGLNFLAVKGPELFSKWVGESEKAVRSLFAKARANAPSIIFFDEIDSLAVIRGKDGDGISVADRVMSQLLVELDGLHERVNVTVIAATNRPDKIDSALLRPGRFDRLLYVGPPNETDRVDVFHVHLRKMPCSADVDIRELARLAEGCTGADISLVCREAAISAIEEDLDALEIRMEHLKRALTRARPSEIQPYQELSERFQRLVYSEAKSEDSRQLSEPSATSSWNPMKWIPQLAYGFAAALLKRQSTLVVHKVSYKTVVSSHVFTHYPSVPDLDHDLGAAWP